MGAPDPRVGKVDTAQTGKLGELTEGSLVVQAGQAAGDSDRPRYRVADRRRRSAVARQARSEGTEAGRRCGSRHPAPPDDVRPRRSAADAGGTRRLHEGHVAGCIRQGRRSAARVAAVRRAVGPVLVASISRLRRFDRVAGALLFKDAWRYRDYVIRAVNSDKPFDRFITEQLAGDLLEARTPEERRELLIATAFRAVRVRSTMRSRTSRCSKWTSPTSRSRRSDGECSGRRSVAPRLPRSQVRSDLGQGLLRPGRDSQEHEGRQARERLGLEPGRSAASRRRRRRSSLAEEVAIAAAQEADRRVEGGRRHRRASRTPPTGRSTRPRSTASSSTTPTRRSSGRGSTRRLRQHFVGKGYLFDDAVQKVDKTVTFQPEFPKSGKYEVRLAYVQGKDRASKVAVRVFHTDGDDTIYIDQKKDPDIDGRFVSLGKFHFSKGNQWFVMLSTEGANGLVVADAVQFIPEEPLDLAEPSKAPPLKRLEEDLRKLIASGPQSRRRWGSPTRRRVPTPGSASMASSTTRGRSCRARFLSVVPLSADPKLKIGANESGRRQLAEWLTSPENPLTARVAVNRIWYHLFGEGIVRTVDNFAPPASARRTRSCSTTLRADSSPRVGR